MTPREQAEAERIAEIRREHAAATQPLPPVICEERNLAVAARVRLERDCVTIIGELLSRLTAQTQEAERFRNDRDIIQKANEHLGQEAERLRELFGMRTPWPITELLRQLAAAADHALMAHDCDHLGHEGVRYAIRAAEDRIRLVESALTRERSALRAETK